MAFDLTKLNPIGGQSRRGTGQAVWTYNSADVITDIDTTGYFNDAAQLLSPNDLIITTVTSSSVAQSVGILIVLSNSGTVVDTSNVISLTSTIPNDSD